MVQRVSIFSKDVSPLNDKLFYSLMALFVFVITSLPQLYNSTNKFTATFDGATNCPKPAGKFIHAILFYILLYVVTRIYERLRFGVGSFHSGLIAKYVLYATLLYLVLSSSESYQLSSSAFPELSVAGCPTIKGIITHSIVFLVVLTLLMYLPRDSCGIALETYNSGFDRECDKLSTEKACLSNPNCGFCISKNKRGSKATCVVDNDNKTNHRPLFAECNEYKYGGTTFSAPSAQQTTQQAVPQAAPQAVPQTTQQTAPQAKSQTNNSESSLSQQLADWLQMLGLATPLQQSSNVPVWGQSPEPAGSTQAVPPGTPQAVQPILNTETAVGNSANDNNSSVASNNASDFLFATDCAIYSGNTQDCLRQINCAVCDTDCVEGDERGPYDTSLDCKGKFLYRRPY